MKIAFVDNLQVGGGLSRFCLKLCSSIIEHDKNIHVDYFIHESNLKQIPEINSLGERVTVKVLETTKGKSKMQLFLNNRLNKVFKIKLFNRDTIREIEERIGTDYDLAYFPSAHMMKMPSLKIPIAGTWHDFNWRYFFGAEIFSDDFVRMMDAETPKWFGNAYCVSSSHDVVNEAKLMYPDMPRYPAVIPIAQVVVSEQMEKSRANEIVKGLGIDYPYLIFPGNFFPHKNHLNLFTAFYLLKQKPAFKDYKLILTGGGSGQIKKAKAEYRGIRKILNDREEFDIRGMGYQSNENIDALIMNANLLVSPSVYEAICTPGMDAWSFGTPTAISDTPPFREHEITWNIKSAFFDPMDPHNMADVIEAYMSNYSEAKEDAEISRVKLAEYSWDLIAKKYLEVFKQATENK